MVQAVQAVERAESDLVAALANDRVARHRLGEECRAQQERAKAVGATEQRRAELSRTLRELDAALAETLAARVAAVADQPLVPAHLIEVIGQPRINPPGRDAWCGLVHEVESYRDRHPEALGHEAESGVMAAIGPRPNPRWHSEPEWDSIARRLGKGANLVRIAAEVGHRQTAQMGVESSWLELLDQANAVMERNRISAERELGRDHGMDLGW